MLVTFAATFSGVLASFILWFASQWLIRRYREKKALNNLLREIEEEIQYNIVVLTSIIRTSSEMIEENTIPAFIPRLSLKAYQYAVASGEIRLVTDATKQSLIKGSGYECEHFNTFAENSELVVAIFLLKTDALQGITGSIHRLKGLIENAQMTRTYLVDALSKLQQGRRQQPTEMLQEAEQPSNEG